MAPMTSIKNKHIEITSLLAIMFTCARHCEAFIFKSNHLLNSLKMSLLRFGRTQMRLIISLHAAPQYYLELSGSCLTMGQCVNA